ncbi:hypothetical protein F4604DRAFT_1927998 [Suillus subluteus]|nr:hypothetical protein F4604DRAFT_1927998 [Suillus subluteus]
MRANAYHASVSEELEEHCPAPEQCDAPFDFKETGYGGFDMTENDATQDPPAPAIDTEFWGTGDRLYRNFHKGLNARPCDEHGVFLPPRSPPTLLSNKSPDDWTPYQNHVEFETAEYFFSQNQTPAAQINKLLDLWALTLKKHNNQPPFANVRDLYKHILQ